MSESQGLTGSDYPDDSSFHDSVFDSFDAASAKSSPFLSPDTKFSSEFIEAPGLAVFVFDLRGKAPFSAVTFKVCSVSNVNSMKRDVAENFRVSEDCVLVNKTCSKFFAVIADEDYIIKNVFLILSGRSITSLPTLHCISVQETMTVGTFIDDVIKKREPNLECVCLYMNKRIFSKSKQRFCEILESSRLIECVLIDQSPLKVRCHYHSKPDVGILYYLNCYNTDCIGELKNEFCRQFGKEFPDLLNGRKEIWFSDNNMILKDEHYPIGEIMDLNNLWISFPVFDISVHINDKNSIPITVHLADVKKRILRKVIMAELHCKSTGSDLRHLVANHFNQEPNSLKLKLKKRTIRDSDLLTSLSDFRPDCHVLVQACNKSQLNIKLFQDNNTSSKTVEIYKHDKVSELRELLAASEGIDPFYMELSFCGAEMKYDRTLKSYRIGSDDTVDVVIYRNRIELTVRCVGKPPMRFVVNDVRTTTVSDVKLYIYLNKFVDMHNSQMNIIFSGKCLDNISTLSEVGIGNRDTVLLCRCSHQNKKDPGKIFPVYVFDDLGVKKSVRCALLYSGKLLFVEDSVQPREEDYSQDADRMKPVPKGIRLVDEHEQGEPAQTLPVSPSNSQQESRKREDHTDSLSEEVKSKLSLNLENSNNGNKGKTKETVPTSESTAPVSSCANIPKTVVAAVQSVYHKEILRDTDGNVIKAESHAFHTSLSREKLAQMSKEDLPSLSRSETMQLGLNKHEQDELDRIFIFLSDDLGNEWQNLALKLELGHVVIENCEQKNPKNLQLQAHGMLCCWRQKNAAKATKEALIEGLKKCDRYDLAQKLKNIRQSDS